MARLVALEQCVAVTILVLWWLANSGRKYNVKWANEWTIKASIAGRFLVGSLVGLKSASTSRIDLGER